MFCANCGHKLNDEQAYCRECGTKTDNSKISTSSSRVPRTYATGIKCFVPECYESVIGQCQGYRGQPCGHFYCASHSKSKLCDECLAVAERDRIYNKYCEAAKRVKGEGFWMSFTIWISLFSTFAFPSIIIMMIDQDSIKWVSYFVVALIASIIATPILIWIMRKKRLNKVKMNLPNFEQFYKEWIRNERNNAWEMAGFIAVSALFYSQSRDARIERDIHRIKNKLDSL